MNRLLRQSFSEIKKVKAKERIRQGSNFPRMPTHAFQDFVGTTKYQQVKQKLSPYQQYLITTRSMQRPYTGNLWAEVSTGFYHCVICDTRLFTFNHKYLSKTGHATFWRAIDDRVKIQAGSATFQNSSLIRIPEIHNNPEYKLCKCTQCQTYLGVIYFDGPAPSFLSYRINSALLKFYDMKDFQNPSIKFKIKQERKKKNIIQYLE